MLFNKLLFSIISLFNAYEKENHNNKLIDINNNINFILFLYYNLLFYVECKNDTPTHWTMNKSTPNPMAVHTFQSNNVPHTAFMLLIDNYSRLQTLFSALNPNSYRMTQYLTLAIETEQNPNIGCHLSIHEHIKAINGCYFYSTTCHSASNPAVVKKG